MLVELHYFTEILEGSWSNMRVSFYGDNRLMVSLLVYYQCLLKQLSGHRLLCYLQFVTKIRELGIIEFVQLLSRLLGVIYVAPPIY